MSESFSTFYNHTNHVIVDDENFTIHEDEGPIMILPKRSLGVLVTNYDRILRDFEDQKKGGKKYYSDEDTVMYTKNVVCTENDRSQFLKVFSIVQAPEEIFLKKEDFQSMLINVAISYRIHADEGEKTERYLEYQINKTTQMIFSDEGFFSIHDQSNGKEVKMDLNALALMIVRKDPILRDLRDRRNLKAKDYWRNGSVKIDSVYKEPRVLCFSDISQSESTLIYINEDAFKRMINIALGGTFRSADMDAEIRTIREIHWKSIPLNTVTNIQFSKDEQTFTLINDVNENTLTLPIATLQAAKKYEATILVDLKNKNFRPTRQKDYIEQYWSDLDYTVRTGPYYDLYRISDCNFVRFTRRRDNYYEFLMNEETFRSFVKQEVTPGACKKL